MQNEKENNSNVISNFFKKIVDFGKENLKVKKALAWVFVIILMMVDTIATTQLFSNDQFDLPSSEALFYGLIFAIFLEGLPIACGYSLNIAVDKNIDETGKRGRAFLGFILSLLTMIGVFVLSVWIRFHLIEISNGAESDDYLVNIFLIFEPILSSLLAFIVSWLILSTNYIDTTKEHVDSLTKKHKKVEEEMELQNNTFRSMQYDLWNSFNSSPKEMPTDWDEFQQEAYKRINDTNKWNTINFYSGQFKRFNSEIEALLQDYIIELSSLSTVPNLVSHINLKELIDEFDEKYYTVEKWNYKDAIPNELKTLTEQLTKNMDSMNSFQIPGNIVWDLINSQQTPSMDQKVTRANPVKSTVTTTSPEFSHETDDSSEKVDARIQNLNRRRDTD